MEGLRGIYIVSQWKNNSKENIEYRLRKDDFMMSLITFDNGGEWHPLEAPRVDVSGNPTKCDTVSIIHYA